MRWAQDWTRIGWISRGLTSSPPVQAPPCDLPVCYAENKASSRARGKAKLSDSEKKLEAGRELTLAQYSKIRYKFPVEMMSAAAGSAAMEDDGAAAAECVLLRLNCDAFEVHFRHEATVEWVASGYGQDMAKVCPADLWLSVAHG